MHSPSVYSPSFPRPENNSSLAPTLRSVVRKSALLNAVIVLTSFPVLVAAAGPKAIIPSLVLMASISFLVWTSTLALFSFYSITRIFFWRPISNAKPSAPSNARSQAGVGDRWLDGPV